MVRYPAPSSFQEFMRTAGQISGAQESKDDEDKCDYGELGDPFPPGHRKQSYMKERGVKQPCDPCEDDLRIVRPIGTEYL